VPPIKGLDRKPGGKAFRTGAAIGRAACSVCAATAAVLYLA